VRVAGLTEAFQMSAGENQAGLVNVAAGLPSLGRRLDGQLVQSLVIELPGIGRRAGRLAQGRKRRQTSGEGESHASHDLMLLQR
jgi:hypothetical protein